LKRVCCKLCRLVHGPKATCHPEDEQREGQKELEEHRDERCHHVMAEKQNHCQSIVSSFYGIGHNLMKRQKLSHL